MVEKHELKLATKDLLFVNDCIVIAIKQWREVMPTKTAAEQEFFKDAIFQGEMVRTVIAKTLTERKDANEILSRAVKSKTRTRSNR